MPDTGIPCTVCGAHQSTDQQRTYIRAREKLADGSTRIVTLVCPDCVARMFLQVERLDLWSQVSGIVMSAIRRALDKRREKGEAKAAKLRELREAGEAFIGLPAPSSDPEEGGDDR